MDIDVERAVREWDSEVDAEMVRLIKSGTPPFEAAGKARDIVSRRRAAENGTPGGWFRKWKQTIEDA